MLTISDIAALAKQGWTYPQVKECIELSKEEPKEETSEEQISARSFLDNADAAEVAAAAPAKEEPEEPEETSEPDYKAMYEKTKLELEQAQKINTKKNIATDIEIKSDSDILNDLFKEFM